MTLIRFVHVFCAAALAALPVQAQSNVVAGRVLGQDALISKATAASPNIVDARGMNNPQGMALDTSVSPPRVFVSDWGNNRVLAWGNAISFSNGVAADLVIGQKDNTSTASMGPGTSQSKGLNAPTALAVDSHGNLYVMDSGNNRILRFPTPFVNPDPFRADQVFGQLGLFSTRGANQGGLSAETLALNASSGVLRGAMAFDSHGNLWVTDPGNHRVLRYPADSANPGKVVATADRVVGQKDFTTGGATSNVSVLDRMNTPAGLAIDSSDNVYVTDAIHRLLVFAAPIANGAAAKYFAGGKIVSGRSPKPPTSTTLNAAQGVAINPAHGEVLVADTYNNRVVWYPPLGTQWPNAASPTAYEFYGQQNENGYKASVSATGLASPVALAVAPGTGELFVVDSTNNRVVVYPQNSRTASRVLGQTGLDYKAPNLIEGKEMYLYDFLQASGGSLLLAGGGVAVDGTGSVPRLYVADTWNNRVLGYCDARKAKQGDKADIVVGQPDLLHSTANGDGGDTPNAQYLWFPTDVAVDKSGNLYVADMGNGRVLRFAPPCNQPASLPTANLVLGQSTFTAHETDPGQGTMSAAYGLAFTFSGNLVVSDYSHNRVLRFDKPAGGDFRNGQAAAVVFGQTGFSVSGIGSDPSQMNGPRHIAIDLVGRLLVADYFNNRVLIFSNADLASSPGLPAVFVINQIDASHPLKAPIGVWADPKTGDYYVGTTQDARVLHYPNYIRLTGPTAKPYILSGVSTSSFPIGIAQDARGNLYVTEGLHRMIEFFPPATTLNGASFLLTRPNAPNVQAAQTAGSLVSAWIPKVKSVPTSHAPSQPLPRTLGGLQVNVAGSPAPMLFAGEVSSDQVQVNFQIPNNAPQSGFVDIQVVDSATQEVYGAWFSAMAAADPGIFTINAQGTGQISAFNVDSSNNRTCNGPAASASLGCPNGTRPIKPGEVLEMYLTGAGAQPGWPQEGTGANGKLNTSGAAPLVFLNTDYIPPANVEYSGVAPGFAGLWQINVRIPNDHINPDGKTPNPIFVQYRDIPSQAGSILVQQQ